MVGGTKKMIDEQKEETIPSLAKSAYRINYSLMKIKGVLEEILEEMKKR